ncbi:MAG: glycosyltransferase family 9 protein [Sterolibacterium sp.]|nr:glycosyltransferase family 9 protein [Sterolibacterium sp.]
MAGSRPQRILLVCTQRLGDVLLTTPLARSLKAAWPEARLDALVLPGTEGALAGNADFDHVMALPPRVGLRERFVQLRSLWRRYDLALSPLPTDRARLACWVAGRRRIGVLHADRERSKALWLDQWVAFDDLDTHTVSMGLRLAELLGIPPIPRVVPPSAPRDRLTRLLARLPADGRDRYVVLHPYPKFAYKMWTPAGWLALARWLQAQGHAVVLSGGPDAAEQAQAQQIARHLDDAHGVLNLAGELSLGETAELIRSAALFVGPDTVASHIAAATGTPTLALFGPSNPVKWGPWPKDWPQLASPWQRQGSARQGNVYLLQGEDARGCVPCLQEGCDRHVDSSSDCLLNLSAQRVIAAASELLRHG